MTTDTLPFTFHTVNRGGLVFCSDPKSFAYRQCHYLKIVLGIDYTVTVCHGDYVVRAVGHETLTFTRRS